MARNFCGSLIFRSGDFFLHFAGANFCDSRKYRFFELQLIKFCDFYKVGISYYNHDDPFL